MKSNQEIRDEINNSSEISKEEKFTLGIMLADIEELEKKQKTISELKKLINSL